MGFFGSKETTLNVGEKKVIVNESTMTFSPNFKNPLKDLVKEQNKKNKKLVIVGLCFNGEFRPKILIDWEKIQKGQGSSTVRGYIKNALKIIDEMLRQKINKWVGCQKSDLFDEKGEAGIGFLDQMFTVEEEGGGNGRILWKLKNNMAGEKSVKLAQNYKRYCRNLREREIICKINPEFVNEGIKDEIGNSIEKNLEEAIERTVNRWLNTGIWKNESLCFFSNRFKFENHDCLKTGKIGQDLHLRKDIKNLIPKLNGNGNMNIEIGAWWLSGKGKSQNKEWGREHGKSDNRGATEKLIEFAGSVGQLKEQTLKQAVKELIEEFEKGIINQKEGFCGVWNKGVSCPDGGVILYKK
ncbi:hypothetical protein [Mycoplasma parvum]|uniref:Uncharacterized protein n=1 Tax=Mycoplasma parvum str. Indiana TaxID=1403316 RepID=U5NCC3_9MOLU|nr:hypothetical protein [Mycoplasma parvum]AGX88960.1 hypothetical protein PRV_00975 [Mycoplasma parvum str. Indiana]